MSSSAKWSVSEEPQGGSVGLWNLFLAASLWEYAALADIEAHSFWFSAQYLGLLINFPFYLHSWSVDIHCL